MSQGSVILKIIALPISILLICLGIMTILGGHITLFRSATLKAFCRAWG